MVADSIITLSGLRGSKTVSHPKFNLTSQSSVFSALAPWEATADDGILRVKVTSNTVGGEIYSLSFTLRNPDCEHAPPDIFIEAIPICFSKIKMTSYVANMSTPSHLSGIWSVQAEESAPLFVRAPSFLVYEVWQTKPFATAMNTIYVKFSTNIDMLVGSPLTVSGLKGAFDYGSDLAVAETGSNVLANAGIYIHTCMDTNAYTHVRIHIYRRVYLF